MTKANVQNKYERTVLKTSCYISTKNTKIKICNMSISFTCLFLVFHYLSLSRLFPSKRKKSDLFTFFSVSLVLCVCVFLKETCVEKKREKKGDGIPCMFFFCLCVYGSRFLCRLILLLFFVSCCCVPNCVFCFFFMLPLLLPPPLFSFIYLLSDCVCVSAFIICCVFACVRAVHSFYFVVSLFSFFRLLKNSLIYSQLKRKKPTVILSFFLCACVLIPTRLLCVCGFLFFLLIIVGFLDAYTIYICMCVCVLCVIIIATEKKKNNQQRKKCLFCSNVWKNNRVRFLFSFFCKRRDLFICMCVFSLCICTCYFQF